MEIIRKTTWLIRKDQETVKNVCCVAVRLPIFPGTCARRIVTGTNLTDVTTL